MRSLLTDLLTGTLDLVFAPICAACHGPIPTSSVERGVCVTCWSRARSLPLPRCDRCWTPLPDRGLDETCDCVQCPSLRPAIRCIRSAYLLEGPVRSIVHALKYRSWHSLARAMG